MLNTKNMKVLSHIINNARISNSRLSKNVHFSREVVDYHIRKLEKNKIILSYQARLNLNYFSTIPYNILIKLKNVDRKTENTLLQSLKKFPYTHFIAKIGGNHDLIIGFTIKYINDLDNYLNNLYTYYGYAISSHELFTELYEIKDDFVGIVDQHATSCVVSKVKTTTRIKLDFIDKQLLKELAHNARVPASVLGKKLSLTGAAIAHRIKRLEKRHIILGYRTIINILKFNKEFYYIFLNIKNPTPSTEKRIQNNLKANAKILFVNKLAGRFSYLFLIYADNNVELHNEIKTIREENKEIEDMNMYTLLDFIYQNYIPKGFLE